MMMSKSELKNIIGDIVNKLVNFFNVDALKINVKNFLNEQYSMGLDKAEVKFNMNFTPGEDIDFLADYAHQNIKEATDQIGKDLRKEISQSILNKEDKTKMVARITELFNDKKYSNRLKMVLRTEGVRANNMGQMDGARQSGLNPDKYLAVIMDQVTSNICKAEHKKYGTEEQAIPFDQEFVVTVKIGSKVKTVRAMQPPFHPNCRSVIMFKRNDVE